MGKVIEVSEIKYPWIRRELKFTTVLRQGASGRRVKTVQEWLTFHKFALEIDGSFGEITKDVVKRFQKARKIEATGEVDKGTFHELTLPMLRVLTPPRSLPGILGELVVEYANKHLKEGVHEIGGPNRGPWVRLYMEGGDGLKFEWCAGFACFILRQAVDTLRVQMPVGLSYYCPSLANNAKKARCFVSENDIKQEKVQLRDMPSGSLFLMRKDGVVHGHAGVVTEFKHGLLRWGIDTVEGNTGDHVKSKTRGYKNIDFIRID